MLFRWSGSISHYSIERVVMARRWPSLHRAARILVVVGLCVAGALSAIAEEKPSAKAVAKSEARFTDADVVALAAKIDSHLSKRWHEVGVQPAGGADDGEFARRG